jgi:hypothetical protein
MHFHNFIHIFLLYMCVCVCVCVRARARVRACVRNAFACCEFLLIYVCHAAINLNTGYSDFPFENQNVLFLNVTSVTVCCVHILQKD